MAPILITSRWLAGMVPGVGLRNGRGNSTGALNVNHQKLGFLPFEMLDLA